MFVFFSHIQLQSFPHAHRPHGLNAEAVANEKWGIATDRLKKNQNLHTGFLVPAHWGPGSSSVSTLTLMPPVTLFGPMCEHWQSILFDTYICNCYCKVLVTFLLRDS
jgi:hypothetical protein